MQGLLTALLAGAVAVAGIVALGSIVWFTWRTGIAPMPTAPKAARAMLAAAAQAPDGDIVDLGSGWGTLAIAFARRFPARRVTGYELSWLPWRVSTLLARAMRVPNARFRRADFLRADLPQAAVLVCYLFPRGMAAIGDALRRGRWRPALVVSNTFALPGFVADEVIRLDDLYRTRIYVYRGALAAGSAAIGERATQPITPDVGLHTRLPSCDQEVPMSPARRPPERRAVIVAAAAVLGAAACPALAHHGWAWAEDGNSEIAGTIVAAKLGNPHGELTVEADGARWIVEVGQPWRNERAGLTDAMLAKGVRITAVGHRHADPKKRVLKAERIVIDGKTYSLYPDRN